MALSRLSMSGWNGHWSISLQNNQRLSGCAYTLKDTRSLTSTNLHARDFTPTAIPTYPHHTLYACDFNCQLHVNSGYNKTSPDGKSLYSWATSNNLGLLYNPKETASLFSNWWNVGTNPDLAFTSFGQDSRLPDRRVLGKFPRWHHRSSRFLPTVIWWSVGTFTRLIGSAFAFAQVNPSRDCHLRTHQILRGHARIFVRAYLLWLNNVSHLAVGRTMCHAGTKTVRPSIAPSSEPQRGLTLILPLRLYYPGSGRRSRSDGRKLSIPSTSHTLAARCGEPTTNSVAGLDAPVTSALSRQTPLPRNSWRTGHTGPGTESSPGWSTRICPTYGSFQHLRVTVFLNCLGRRSLLLPSDAWSQESLRNWIPSSQSSYTPRQIGSQILVCNFLSSCMRQLKIPKIWKKALIVAIPKPEKPLGDPKSYHPISLLCVAFEILERLIYARVEPIIDPLRPW